MTAIKGGRPEWPDLVLGLLLPVVYFAEGPGWTFIICLLATTGTAASATGSLSPHWGLFRGFVAAIEAPGIQVLLLSGDIRTTGLGVIVLIFLGQNFHKQYWSE